MSTPDPTAMVIRRPADLLRAVPYLVGFPPADSAVIVGLDEYRIAFTARIDLPGPGDDLDEYREYVARVVGITARHAARAMLVGYGPAEAVTPVIDLARHHLARHRIPVLEALRLTDGRYWSYTCTNPACCPPGGAVYQPATAAAAHAVAAGLVALPSRDHLVASLAPQPDRQADLRRALPHAAAILSPACPRARCRRRRRRARLAGPTAAGRPYETPPRGTATAPPSATSKPRPCSSCCATRRSATTPCKRPPRRPTSHCGPT